MARTLTNRELVDEISKRGAFQALEHFVETGTITRELASTYMSAMYGFFLRQIQEAQREVYRLQAVLTRLNMLCEDGRRAKTWISRDPRAAKVAQELVALDGWVISLYETDLTMWDFATPERGKEKAYEFADSYEALRQKRITEVDFKIKDSSLFKVG
jgi:hypothetical protein